MSNATAHHSLVSPTADASTASVDQFLIDGAIEASADGQADTADSDRNAPVDASLSARIALAMTALIASIALSQAIELPRTAYLIAVAVHVMAMVVAFGAVVVVDWYGLLWMSGRRELKDSLRVSNAVDPLIWGGLSVIVVSGALLHPNLMSGITQFKLLCVALLTVNGLAASGLRARLNAMPEGTTMQQLPTMLRHRIMVATTLSQIGWWGAILVGFINDALRR